MRLFSAVFSVLAAALDAVFPRTDETERARSLGRDELKEFMHPAPHPRESWILALFPYREPAIRALVKSVKYRGEREALAALAEVAAPEIAWFSEKHGFLKDVANPLLVPIPASAMGLRKRGYNQAERIAESLARELGSGFAYLPGALQRKERKSQVGLPRREREQNIANAFSVRAPEAIRGRHIILVDDVVESAATLKDARRALLESGAADVIAVAIAH